MFLVALLIFIGASIENWKEVVSMTADCLTIVATVGSTLLGGSLRRGNELR